MRTRIAIAAATAAAIVITACGRGEHRVTDSALTDSATHASTASGSVAPASDTTHGAISATTGTIGPGIQVTTTDQHNVNRSFDLKLTSDDWAKFVKAADSVAAL